MTKSLAELRAAAYAAVAAHDADMKSDPEYAKLARAKEVRACERERKAAVAARGKLVRMVDGQRIQLPGYAEADARVTRAFAALRAAHGM